MNGSKRLLVALLCLGCTHSDAFVPTVGTVGPFSSGSDLLLTLNPDQDYWPAWTQDGKGILYSFVDPEHVLHRCLGLLPSTGGTRLWQWCDNRAVRDDSTNSFLAYALDSAGRLLVAEAVSPAHSFVSSIPHSVTLWLADTARPAHRQQLLILPQSFAGTTVTSLADLQWTSPSTFVALGQNVIWTVDSIFAGSGGILLAGSITGAQATLVPLLATQGVTGYSLAAGGATIAFSVRNDFTLHTIPVSGGAPSPPVSPRDDTLSHQHGELLGLSCKGTTCVVARAPVVVAGDYLVPLPGGGWIDSSTLGYFIGNITEVRLTSLIGGAETIVRADSHSVVFATPRISPVNGDVVLQVGGGWGHLQSFGSRGALHLYKGLVP